MNEKTDELVKVIETAHNTLNPQDTIQFISCYLDTTTAHAMGIYKRYLKTIGYTYFIDHNFNLVVRDLPPLKYRRHDSLSQLTRA